MGVSDPHLDLEIRSRGTMVAWYHEDKELSKSQWPVVCGGRPNPTVSVYMGISLRSGPYTAKPKTKTETRSIGNKGQVMIPLPSQI